MNKHYFFRKFVLLMIFISLFFLSYPITMMAQINVKKPSNSTITKNDAPQGSDEEKAERKRRQAATQVLVFNENPNGELKVLSGNDCDLASTVCSSSTIFFNPSNAGNNDFLAASNDDGCLSGEHLSAWYYFEFRADMPPNSSVDFVIAPNNPGNDYDFAVWGPNANCNNLGAPTRCSFANPSGNTGLSPNSADVSEGAGGDNFVRSIIANPGDGFFLMVDNWSQSNQGFELNWSNTGSSFLDCDAVPPCGLNVNTSNNLTMCAGSIAQDISGTANGGAGGISYTWSSNPPSAVAYLSNPNAASTTVNIPVNETNPNITYTLTAADETGCEGNGVVMITVTQGPPPQLDPIPSMCNEAPPIELDNVQNSILGTWSGSGMNGNTFNPANLMGDVILTFTPNSGSCSSVATTTVQITSASAPVLDVFPPVCVGAGSILNLPPVQDGLNGTWSGDGVTGNQFDPTNLSSPVTLTFTPNGDCSEPSTTNISITPETTPVLDNFDPICETSTPIPLPNSQGSYLGTWSGDGVVGGNQFDPTNLSGSATITFTPDAGQCATSADANIILETPTSLFINPIEPLCEVEGLYQLDFQVEGIFGIWSGAGVSGDIFDPFGLSGSIELTFIPDSGECAEPASTFVDIDSSIPISLDAFNPICGAVGNSMILPPSQSGVLGTWSGNGVFNNEFDPTGITGSANLIFTPDPSFCAEPAMTNIVVVAPQSLQIPSFANMCSGDAAITLPPSVNGVLGTWSGDGVIGNQFDPFGLNGNAFLTFTPEPSFCTDSDVTNIFVSEGQSIILDGFPSMCEGDGLINLPFQQSNLSGTWSGLGVTGNTFDPFGLVGVAELTFIPNPGQCVEAASIFIDISPSTPLVLADYGTFCDNAGVIDLPFAPNGINGVWSGSGVIGNSFNPAGQLGLVELIFTPNSGQCSETASTFIEVTLGQNLNLDVLPPLCDGAAPVFLNPSQSGVVGTWSGNGLVSGVFYPSVQSGLVELIFIPEDGQCVEPVSMFVNIFPNQTLTLDEFEPICTESTPFNLPLVQNGLFGTWSGQGVSNGLFDPLGLDENIELTFTPDADQCANTASTFVNITSGEEVVLDNFGSICNNENLIDLPSIQSDVTGIWTGNGVDGTQFDPFGLNGNIELTFTPDAGQCANAASTFVNITSGEEVILDNFESICGNENPIDLPFIQSDVIGIWSGNGVSDDQFDPFGLNGNIELTFIPDAGQCANAASTFINITSGEEVVLDNFEPICNSENPIDLPFIQSDVTGIWSGNGVSGDQFDAFGLNGNIELIFTPDAGQCAEINSTFINVEGAMTPQLENLGPYCEQDATVSLSTNQHDIEGEWIGDGVVDNIFNPFGQGGRVELIFIPNEDQCAETVSIFVDVEIAPFAEVMTNTNICNINSFNESTVVDFESMIVTGQTNGTWTDINNSGVLLNNPSAINFEGVAPDVYTFTYTVSSEIGICSEQMYELSVLVENCACPSVATNSPEELCNENGVLDLSSLQQTTENGTWTLTNVPSDASQPAELDGTIFDATHADAGTYRVTFTLNETPFTGCPATSEQFIIVNEALSPTLNVLEPMCSSDEAVMLSNVQDGIAGIWSGDGVIANQFNPTNQNGTIELTFTPNAGQCAEANSTTIEVGTPAEATLNNTNLNTCNTSADGSRLDFAALIISGDANGTWIDTDETGADLSDLTNVDFDGVTASQQTYTFTYMTNSAIAPCLNPSYEIEVLVENCVCPSVATTAPEILCNMDGMTDLSALQITAETGIWTITQTPEGAQAAILDGTMFDASAADAGTYQLTFTINNLQADCPISSIQTLIVEPVFIPNLTSLNPICTAVTSLTLPNIQDGLLGEWSGDGVNNNEFNPSNLIGDIELTFIPTESNCVQNNSTIITVTNEITPVLDVFENLCHDASVIELPTTQSNITGTWSGDGVNDNQFAPTNQMGDIELTFTPNSEQCASINTTIISVIDCSCPPLGTNAPTGSLCNENGSINLATLVAANSESGTWTITNAPIGSNSAILNGTLFDATGADEGNYEVTYTLNSPQIDCPDSETQIITVSAAIIPILEPIADLCETDDTISLSTNQNGITGNWTGTGVSNNQFTPNAQSGTNTLIFIPNAGQCAIANTIDVAVGLQAFANFGDTNLNTCNASVDGSILNFAALIIEGDTNGTWADTDGTGVDLSNPAIIDFDGITESNYTFTYTTTNAVAPCLNQSYEIEVFVENCECPSVALGIITAQCNDNILVDLNSVQLTAESGTWAIISAPTGNNSAILNGTTFDGTNADGGIYTLEFTLDNPQFDCPNVNTVTIVVDEIWSAGIANSPITICNSENTNIALFDEISDEDNGGTWTETSVSNSTNNAFNFNNATFNPLGQAAGIYTFNYTIGSSVSACLPAQTTVTIIVQTAPIANAGNDQVMVCTEPVFLNGSASIGSNYEWTNEVGDVIGTTPTITVSEHGIYTLTVSSGLCEETDIVIIDSPNAPMELTYNVIEPNCLSETGSVSLNIQGGTMPYIYLMNGTESLSSQFSNLEPRTYDLEVIDAIGCTISESLLIPEPIEVTLDLGDDQEVDLGDEVDLTAITNISTNQIANITWSQDSICVDDCIEAVLKPIQTVIVSATIVDENGCSATDEIQIFVNRQAHIYPPNAFSPDKDGYNDYFMIYTGKNVAEFISLQVFNRWGEVVFYNYDMTLNQTDMGWDGTFKGKELNPEFFVWWAEFKLTDGSTILKKGNVSLVK